MIKFSMLPARISLVQGQISQNRANAVLKNGTIVTGRVLERKGDGLYTVSLAGQKINVKSDAFLKPGSVFSAKVDIKGNVLNLFLVKEDSESRDIFQKISAKTEFSPQVTNLLSSLGFEPNVESLKILLFMQQLGMKINVPQAKKALAKSKSEGKVNQEKAEISFLLEEKGIRSDDERVNAIIRGNGKRKEENGKRKDESGKWKTENGKLKDENEKPEHFVDYCEQLSMTKDYFESVDSAAVENEAGVLTAFNTVLSKNKENPPLNHWLVLPFEWEFQKSFGNIKLLFDSELKNLQKTIIDIKTSDKNRIFVLYYHNNEVDSVSFATNENLSENKKSAMCEVLSSMFKAQSKRKILVHTEDFESLKGFSPADGDFGLINGKV